MKYIALVFLFFAITACRRTVKTNETDLKLEKIKINLMDTSKKYVEDIMDSVKAITITDGKDFALSEVSNFFFTDSAIIIADHVQSAIFIFNRNGKLLRKINTSHPKGSFKKGDFNTITDMWYNNDAKLIEILDRTASKIFRFNVKGRATDTLLLTDTKAFGYQFVGSKNCYYSILLNHNIDRRGIGEYKKDGQFLRYNAQYLDAVPYLRYTNLLLPHQLDVFDGSVYYLPPLSDKIYNITRDIAEPAYMLDYPEQYKLTTDVRNAEPTRDIYAYYRKMVLSNIIYQSQSLFINGDWVTFRFNFGSMQSPRNILYSKKSKRVLQFSELAFKTGRHILPHAKIVGKYRDFFVMLNVKNKPKLSNVDKKLQSGNFEFIFFKLKGFKQPSYPTQIK
jgi:hypothetical protein